MPVARIPSTHEYVHHVVNMSLCFFERQIPLGPEGPRQIRVTAVVVFRDRRRSTLRGPETLQDQIEKRR